MKKSAKVKAKGRPSMNVKAGDTVRVISGADKGTEGQVIRVERYKQRVVVQGVNKKTKHLRRSQDAPRGGRLDREAPIHASNVVKVEDE